MFVECVCVVLDCVAYDCVAIKLIVFRLYVLNAIGFVMYTSSVVALNVVVLECVV